MSQQIPFSQTGASNVKQLDVANGSNTDNLQCFVCDAKVQEKHYALASCRTQTTRTRVIEKLGELVGESHMVVISENDVICRSCANLINTLDRLENEIKGVKGTVLQYLERKYGLEEGELNDDSVKPVKQGQPPHVTQTSENGNKRKTVNLPDESISKSKKKKSVLLQCDKCKYMTEYNTFMVHHVRQHINQKINCDRCGAQFVGNNQKNNSHSCKEKQKPAEINNQNEVDMETSEADTTNLPLENGDLAEDDITTTHVESIFVKEDVDQKIFNLPDLETGHISTEYVVPEPTAQFLNQEHNVNEDLKPSIRNETDSNGVVIKRNPSTKQILTVAEDGSLQMREVKTWDDKKANEEESQKNN